MCFASLFCIIITQQNNPFFYLNLLPSPPLSSHEYSERRKTGHIRHNRISLTVFLGVLSGWKNYIIVHCCYQVERSFKEEVFPLNEPPNPQLNNCKQFLVYDMTRGFLLVITISSGTVVKMVCCSALGICLQVSVFTFL